MARKTRWMTWVLDQSATTEVEMPWTRGENRTPWKDRMAAKAPELTYANVKSA